MTQVDHFMWVHLTSVLFSLLLWMGINSPPVYAENQSHLTLQLGHSNDILALAFSPDGKIMASAGEDSVLVLWDVQTGQELRAMHGHMGKVRALAFSPDGQYLISAGAERLIKLWHVPTGQWLHDFYSEWGWNIRAIAFSKDGNELLSWEDLQLKVWQVKTGQCSRTIRYIASLARPFGPLGEPDVSPFETFLESINFNDALTLWQDKTGLPHAFSFEPPTGENGKLVFSPDGKMVLTESLDLFDRETGKLLQHYTQGEEHPWITALAFHPSGHWAATSMRQYTELPVINLWDVRTGKTIQSFQGYGQRLDQLAVSADGSQVAIAAREQIQLWDIEQRKLLKLFSGVPPKPFPELTHAVQFSKDGQLLFSGGEQGMLRIWEIKTGKILQTIPVGSHISSLQLSKDGKILFIGAGKLLWWDIKAKRAQRTLSHPNHYGWATASAVSQNGALMAWGKTEHLEVWDIHKEKRIQQINALNINQSLDTLSSVAISPDNRWVATGNTDHFSRTEGTVRIWDIQTGKRVATFQAHPDMYEEWTDHHMAEPYDYVMAIAFSPDGRQIACTRADGKLKVWELKTKKLLYAIQGHYSWSLGLAYSPNGKYILSAGLEGSLQVRQAQTGQLVYTALADHNGEYAAWTPDSVTGSVYGKSHFVNVVKGLSVHSNSE